MRENMEERAERLALYIIENRATVRAAARAFAVSKSTVHTDATIGNGAKVMKYPIFAHLTAFIRRLRDYGGGEFLC